MKTRLRLVPFVLAFALLVAFRNVAPAPADRPSTTMRPANAGRVPASAPVPDEIVSTQPAEAASEEDTVAPEAPTETSWARELRELKELAAVSPDAALARVAQMHEAHDRKAAGTAVCLTISKSDPAKATLAAWELELGRFANDRAEDLALEHLAMAWAKTDASAAARWANALPPDDESRRDHLIKGVAATLAVTAPDEAARLVAQRITPDTNVQVDAAIEVLRQWAARDYSAAVAWAARFPEGFIRERGLDALAEVEPAK